ncbi:MAG TPA: hypothetical protein VNU97_05980 [Rhizomicrobium sp.]|jgi:hypothetical protein|nr:hypothetical protein [Rhizomicrobium sp.]
MSKYDALGDYLSKQFGSEIPMTFTEIEKVIGLKLPPKAQHYRAWWSNNPSNNVMTKVWLAAGFQTEQVDMASRKLVFKRKDRGAGLPPTPPALVSASRVGMAETPREFTPPETSVQRHPALGAMKGTFTIEPGYDLTKPVYTDEEWEEIEGEMVAKFDRMFPDGIK